VQQVREAATRCRNVVARMVANVPTLALTDAPFPVPCVELVRTRTQCVEIPDRVGELVGGRATTAEVLTRQP